MQEKKSRQKKGQRRKEPKQKKPKVDWEKERGEKKTERRILVYRPHDITHKPIASVMNNKMKMNGSYLI